MKSAGGVTETNKMDVVGGGVMAGDKGFKEDKCPTRGKRQCLGSSKDVTGVLRRCRSYPFFSSSFIVPASVSEKKRKKSVSYTVFSPHQMYCKTRSCIVRTVVKGDCYV